MGGASSPFHLAGLEVVRGRAGAAICAASVADERILVFAISPLGIAVVVGLLSASVILGVVMSGWWR